MSPADFIAVFAFLSLLLLGLFVMTIQNSLRRRPAGRVRSRLANLTQLVRNPVQQEAIEDLSRAQRDARRRKLRQSMGWLGRYLGRVETVGGRRWVINLVAGTLFLFAGSALASALFLPLPWWGKAAAALVVPALGAVTIYRHLNEKFRRAFLQQLPDILDMIIRASQAGIPITQSIRNVGEEFTWPAGPEFARIGDSLFLGNDMTTVMDEAEARIQLPDFSFLSVCLLLQRETGGSLSDTLSNLASVVRARRELRLKTRALTAEGRLAGAMISAIPIVILAMMTALNPDYSGILYDTEAGNKILMVAFAMLIVGVAAIRKISNLEP